MAVIKNSLEEMNKEKAKIKMKVLNTLQRSNDEL